MDAKRTTRIRREGFFNHRWTQMDADGKAGRRDFTARNNGTPAAGAPRGGTRPTTNKWATCLPYISPGNLPRGTARLAVPPKPIRANPGESDLIRPLNIL